MANAGSADGVFTVKNNAQSQNISVYARVRPSSSQEAVDWKFADTSITSARGNSTREYQLDGVFHQATTRHVYERSTKHLIQPVLDGFGCTIFAYGQTASGKTHTMRGTAAEPGIVVHAVKDLFDGVVKSAKEQKREFCIRASYLEIYNEEVNDLLDTGKRNLSLKADSEKGIMVAGLSESLVYTVEDVMAVFEKGDMNRRVGETKMNEASSRSHSIFRVVVESTSIEEAEKALQESNGGGELDAAVTIGELNLVDLAGSERATKTGAEGSRLKEGANINKSLLTLGLVIKSLSESSSQGETSRTLVDHGEVEISPSETSIRGTRTSQIRHHHAGRHIPYRDSKLTRILQPSLGGSGRTAIICTISMQQVHCEESHNTLEFATRAKRVVNTVSATETMTSAALLKRQAKEIDKLKDQLRDKGETNMADGIKELQQRLLDMEKELEMKEARNKQVTKEKEFYERQNTMLAAQRTAKRCRRRDTFHFDLRTVEGASPASPTNSYVSGECGSHMQSHMPTMMETLQEEDDVTGMTAPAGDETNGDFGGGAKRIRRHGSTAGDTMVMEMQEDVGITAPSTAPSTGPSVEEPFAQELRVQLRHLRQQKAEVEANLEKQKQDAEAREQELLIEVANAQHATSEGQQLRACLEEDLKKTKLSLASLECMQRKGNSELAQTEQKVVGLQEQIAALDSDKANLEEQIEKQRTEFQELLEEKKQEAARAQEELALKARELHHAQHATDKSNVDVNLLREREQNRQAEAEKHMAAQKALRDELEAAQLKVEAAEDSQKAAEESLEDANEEIERLRKHVADLESRKRPPLYQRKQEEELQAAKDHASECEQRANAAEASMKTLQHELTTAQNSAEDLKQQLDFAQSRHEEELKASHVRADFDLQEARKLADQEKQELEDKVQRTQDALSKQTEAARNLQTQLADAAEAAEAAQTQSDGKLAARQLELTQTQDTIREYEEAMQASSARIQELEDQVAAQESSIADLTQKLEEISKNLTDTRAAAASDAATTAEAHEAAIVELKKKHAEALEEMVNKALDIEAEAEKEAEAKLKETQEREAALAADHQHALEVKSSEMAAVLEEKAKLQTLVDESAAAHKAHAELKELKVRSKQEIAQLTMQLKAANMSSKGGDKARQGLAKDLDKLQKKIADAESKVRNMSDEKMQLNSEKAALERKAKVTESQISKLTKELEKKDGVCNRKINAIQEDLSKVQKQKAVLESSLQHAQAKHDTYVQESVAKTEAAAAALAQAESTSADYASRLEECQQMYMDLENESDAQAEQLKETQTEVALRKEEISQLTNAKETLAAQLAATETTLEEQATSSQALEDDLARCQEELQRVNEVRSVLEEKASMVKTLSAEVADLKSALADRDTAMTDAAAALEAAVLEAGEAAKREARVRDDLARHVASVSELQQKLTEVDAAWQAAQRDLEAASTEATKLRGESGELALCREQLQKANDEIEELYAKNEELEAALEQLATKLAEADEQQKLARSKEEKLIEEKEALVSKHVAANAEKNQRIEELSSEVRNAKICEQEALIQQDNLQVQLQVAESEKKQHEMAKIDAVKEAEDYRWELQSLQKELKNLQQTIDAQSMHGSFSYRQVKELEVQIASLENDKKSLREAASVELAAAEEREKAACAVAGGLEKERDALQEQLRQLQHSGNPASSQETETLRLRLAELQAQNQESIRKLQELDAQLQEKVQWQARNQKQIDQYDRISKQLRRDQWDQKRYRDTLINMSKEFARRKLMNQKAFKDLQADLENKWEQAAKRLVQKRGEEQPQVPQTESHKQSSTFQAAPAPSMSRRASLPPRAPRPVQDLAGSASKASVHEKQSAGQELAEASGQPRRALGELPVQ